MTTKKCLDILKLFDFDMTTLSVPIIADKLGQPQSSVYRHIRLLKDEGFIEEKNGTYKLGHCFLKFARIVKSDISITSIARPIMEVLTRESEETSILLVRSGYNAVCLETVPSTKPIKVSSEQGEIIPLNGGASSKALLAFMEDEFIDDFLENGIIKQFTQNTITNRKKLKAHIEEIRRNGYAISDSEIDEGVLAYGMPIRDNEQNVIASLSIAGPSERMKGRDQKHLVSLLKKSIDEIEQYL